MSRAFRNRIRSFDHRKTAWSNSKSSSFDQKGSIIGDGIRHKWSPGLTHEAIGDYLRATRLAQKDSVSLIAELVTLEVDSDSLFPVFLAALVNGYETQRALLQQLAYTDLQTYCDVMRYRTDVSAEILGQTSDEFIRNYLRDLLEGIEKPLSSFFPELRSDIVKVLVGAPVRDIAISGHGSPEYVEYTFLSAQSGTKVTVAQTPVGRNIFGVNLKLGALKPNSGPTLQVSEPEGGKEWIAERLFGRLRLFAYQSKCELDLHARLEVLESQLLPFAGELVRKGRSSDLFFTVASMLEDINLLKQNGDTHLHLWWEAYDLDVAATRNLLDDFYKRLQLVYKEVVEHSFRTVASGFAFYTSLPVRWNLQLIHRYNLPLTLQYTWHPVANWDEAGADVQPSRRTRSSDYEIRLQRISSSTTQVWSADKSIASLGWHRIRAAL